MAGKIGQALLASPEGSSQYRAALEAMVFSSDHLMRLTNRVDEVLPRLKSSLTSREWQEVRLAATDLKRRMIARWEFLARELRVPEPPQLNFENGIASPMDWQPFRETPAARLEKLADGSLRIAAAGETSASWRSQIRLPEGRYIFEAVCQLDQVAPLPFGRNQGVGLRVIGLESAPYQVVGTYGAKSVAVEFTVQEEGQTVILACELRASAGEVQFQKASLLVRRLVRGFEGR